MIKKNNLTDFKLKMSEIQISKDHCNPPEKYPKSKRTFKVFGLMIKNTEQLVAFKLTTNVKYKKIEKCFNKLQKKMLITNDILKFLIKMHKNNSMVIYSNSGYTNPVTDIN